MVNAGKKTATDARKRKRKGKKDGKGGESEKRAGRCNRARDSKSSSGLNWQRLKGKIHLRPADGQLGGFKGK